VPLYGQRRGNNDNELSDDSGSVTSLHRDPPLHRSNMMVWRDHWQPTTAHRLPNADRNNNSNGGKTSNQTVNTTVYVQSVNCNDQRQLVKVASLNQQHEG